MAIKFANVKAGDTYYERHRYKMGNTTMSRLGEWPCDIVAVETRGVQYRWNGNPDVRFATIRTVVRWFSWSMDDTDVCEMRHGRPHKLTKAELAARKPKSGGA